MHLARPLGRDLRAVTIGLAALGAGLAWVGVLLVDAESGHGVGTALLGGGTAVIGGAVVAGVLGRVQQGIDDARSTREAERAEAAGIDLALATNRTLQNLDLSGRDLSRRYLGGRDLSHSDLGECDLRGAVLRHTTLVEVDLTGSDLTGADLTGAVLTGADLTGATLTAATLPPGLRPVVHSDATTVWPAGYA